MNFIYKLQKGREFCQKIKKALIFIKESGEKMRILSKQLRKNNLGSFIAKGPKGPKGPLQGPNAKKTQEKPEYSREEKTLRFS